MSSPDGGFVAGGGEFVPKHDDFQVFEVVRSKMQGSDLKNPPKDDVTERENTNPPEQPR
jgi:hypothetical protein